MTSKLGILAGSGALPGRLVDLCRREKRECFVLAFEGHTDPATVAGAEHAWLRLGSAASGIEILRQAGVAELVMAGAVSRPSLADLKPDLGTARWLARIGIGSSGDDGLLRSIIRALEAEGFAATQNVFPVRDGYQVKCATEDRRIGDGTAADDVLMRPPKPQVARRDRPRQLGERQREQAEGGRQQIELEHRRAVGTFAGE